jgi:glyoxylate reductase
VYGYTFVRVFVSRRVPEVVLAALEEAFDVTIHDSEEPPGRDELLREAAGSAGLVTMLTDAVDAELLDAAGTDLRVVANYAVGVDNVDLGAARERGIVVSNTPDVLTYATAELTIALVLTLLRRVAEGDRLVRRGGSWRWAPTFMLGRGLAGRTLGIVGMGRIGREVGRLAGRLGMRVVHAPPLEPVLAAADVVTLHVPLTPDTFHLLDAAALASMRPEAVLVNTSRGAVVDERALADALEQGRIAGAALDVFEREPEVDERLRRLDNVVLSPHLGSATEEARIAMGMLCVEALKTVLLEGRRPRNAVT